MSHITMRLDPEDLLRVEHNGNQLVLHFKPAKVPVGVIGVLTVKSRDDAEITPSDHANLRVDSLGKLFLQDAGASGTVPPARPRK